MGLMNFWRLQITEVLLTQKHTFFPNYCPGTSPCGCFLISCSPRVCHLAAILFLAHLSSVPDVNEGTHWLEGTGTAGQEVGAVVGLQETDKVGALRLQEERSKEEKIHRQITPSC